MNYTSGSYLDDHHVLLNFKMYGDTIHNAVQHSVDFQGYPDTKNKTPH